MSNLVLGRGEIYFDRFAAGTENKTGERYLGATPSFAVSGETQELEHYSSERGLRVKDESVTLQIDFTGALTLEDINQDNLALFFFGAAENATIAGATGQTDSVTVKQDRFYQLGTTAAKPEGVENVTTVTVTGTGATPTYVLDTDYTVDLALGRIYIIPGGGIADDTAVELNYDIVAQSQERVASGSTLVTGALRFISFNGVGTNRNFYMPKVTLRPNGEFALKGEEWQNFGLNVEILQAGTNLENLYIAARGITT